MRNLFGILYSADRGPVAIAEFRERELVGDEVYFNQDPLLLGELATPGSRFEADVQNLGTWIEHYDERKFFDIQVGILLRGFFQVVDNFPPFTVVDSSGNSVEVSDIEAVLFIDHNLDGNPEYWREEHEILSGAFYDTAEVDVFDSHFPQMREALQQARQRLDELEARCKAAGLNDNLKAWMSVDEDSHSLTVAGSTIGFKRDEIFNALNKFMTSGAAVEKRVLEQLASKKASDWVSIFDIHEV